MNANCGSVISTSDGRDSRRTIWPFALGFFDRVRVVVAWCEMREDFRHFRTDRIGKVQVTDERYPRRRQVLLKEWREAEESRNSPNSLLTVFGSVYPLE